MLGCQLDLTAVVQLQLISLSLLLLLLSPPVDARGLWIAVEHCGALHVVNEQKERAVQQRAAKKQKHEQGVCTVCSNPAPICSSRHTCSTYKQIEDRNQSNEKGHSMQATAALCTPFLSREANKCLQWQTDAGQIRSKESAEPIGTERTNS